jgi:hypothetical protein
MGMIKNYLLQLLANCSDQQFGQDAVEWAILHGRVKLTGNLEADLHAIMGPSGHPEAGLYDQLIEEYQAVSRYATDRLLSGQNQLLTNLLKAA